MQKPIDVHLVKMKLNVPVWRVHPKIEHSLFLNHKC
ncbi:unnamed protein product [Schistosoma curassoni]|uniref:Uncharacterized protein n=1 Tax=Schistosoma curassoni TaxID=6186 RepID=A0A183JTH4_9TREM|nr:unnamed protein product [Schistosoma curassoni]